MANAKRTPENSGNVTDIAEARRLRESAKGGDTQVNAKSGGDEGAAAPPAQTKAKKAKKSGTRKFNHEKVAAIKAAIANGTYTIDPQRVADKFIEQESP